MKCMKNERLEAYQERENLKNLEETFEESNWSEMREFRRENKEQSRERSSEMRTGSHEEVEIEPLVMLDK